MSVSLSGRNYWLVDSAPNDCSEQKDLDYHHDDTVYCQRIHREEMSEVMDRLKELGLEKKLK